MGTEHAPFWLVAQYLNQLHHRIALRNIYKFVTNKLHLLSTSTCVHYLPTIIFKEYQYFWDILYICYMLYSLSCVSGKKYNDNRPLKLLCIVLYKNIIIIIIIIIIFVFFVIIFMPDIYNYIPETNHVSRVESIAAVLYLQYVLHVILFRPWKVYYYYYYTTQWNILHSNILK